MNDIETRPYMQEIIRNSKIITDIYLKQALTKGTYAKAIDYLKSLKTDLPTSYRGSTTEFIKLNINRALIDDAIKAIRDMAMSEAIHVDE